jgi:hypothetical protein
MKESVNVLLEQSCFGVMAFDLSLKKGDAHRLNAPQRSYAAAISRLTPALPKYLFDIAQKVKDVVVASYLCFCLGSDYRRTSQKNRAVLVHRSRSS